MNLILRRLFHIPALMYVDDLFMVVPAEVGQQCLKACMWVLESLLGWTLDSQKTQVGYEVTILGVAISLDRMHLRCSLPDVKRSSWLRILQECLVRDELPGGKLRWECSRMFSCCAKAVLRRSLR